MVLRPGSNLAVLAACPPPDTDWPMPSASDDEKASIRNIWGLWRSRPCLVSSLHITPDDVMAMSDERSQRPSLASRAPRIGLAKASPTMAMAFTPLARSEEHKSEIQSLMRTTYAVFCSNKK